MPKRYLIGVDCGTTNVKAVLYDERGSELRVASRKNEVNAHGVCSEQDMEMLWRNVSACLREMTEAAKLPAGTLAGIGVSAQGEGLWPIDREGQPVRSAILWNDGRAYELVDDLKADRPRYEDIKRRVASYLKNGSTLALIAWFRRHEPELFEKTAYFFTCKDYIRYRLTGRIAWEWSDATCSCVDMGARTYSAEAFEAMGVGSALSKLPPLIAATDRAGEVTAQAAEETGLPVGLGVSGGMLDIISTAAGLGAVRLHDTCVILGTTGMTLSVLDAYTADTRFNGWELHMDGKHYAKGMGCMAATPNLDWAVARFFPGEEPGAVFTAMERELAGRMPGSGGLLYHPHISTAGERAPFFNSRATAQLLGIRQDSTPMDVLQAVLEGVSLSVKDCLRDVKDLRTVYLSGGGAKSGVWAQMLSDAIGAEVLVTSASELSAKGAALSAALMSGVLGSVEEVKERFITVKTVYKPDAARMDAFEDLYHIYKKTQAAMEPFWDWRFTKMQEEQKI